MAEEVAIEGLKLHKIAGMHPMYTSTQFSGLVDSIAENGLREPITLYRGKVVDGRHRLKALTQLGHKTIKSTHIPNNKTIEEVKKLVNATDVRRHLSPTQLAVKANRRWEDGKSSGMDQNTAIRMAQSNKTNFKRVRTLVNLGRQDLVDMLGDGVRINVSNNPSFSVMSDSLSAVIDWVKAQNASTMDNQEDTTVLDPIIPVIVNTAAVTAAITALHDWTVADKKALISRLYISME